MARRWEIGQWSASKAEGLEQYDRIQCGNRRNDSPTTLRRSPAKIKIVGQIHHRQWTTAQSRFAPVWFALTSLFAKFREKVDQLHKEVNHKNFQLIVRHECW